jgi:hypothetical protein
MKILELFCGLGGWSKGFHDIFPDAEFYGIDIKDFGYPYNFIKADLNDWEPDQEYDIVLASPPCTNFSQVVKQWTGKANESKGLDLVWRTYALIAQIKPKYWIIENVKGLGEFLPPPNDIVRYGKNKQCKEAWLWSNIGKLALFSEMISRKTSRETFKSGDPILGEIPLPLAHEAARKIYAQL